MEDPDSGKSLVDAESDTATPSRCGGATTGAASMTCSIAVGFVISSACLLSANRRASRSCSNSSWNRRSSAKVSSNAPSEEEGLAKPPSEPWRWREGVISPSPADEHDGEDAVALSPEAEKEANIFSLMITYEMRYDYCIKH